MFVRTVELVSDAQAPSPVRSRVPDELNTWVDRRVASRVQFDPGEREHGIDVVEDVLTLLGNVEGVDVAVRASLLLLGRPATVEVFVECESASLLPDKLLEMEWTTIFESCLMVAEGRKLSIDDVFEQAVARWPPEWQAVKVDSASVTTFGSVAFISRSSPQWRQCEGRVGQVVDEALRPGHQLFASRNHLRIAPVDQPSISRQEWWGYLMLASLGSRSRHLKRRIEHLIADVADDSFDRPWQTLRAMADIQKEALATGPDLIGAELFGDERLIALHQRTCDLVELSALERQQLQDSLSNLDRYVNGLFSVAVDQSQDKFATFGLMFGVLSLLLASLAVLDVMGKPSSGYLLLCAANLAMAAVLLAGVRHVRAKDRR